MADAQQERPWELNNEQVILLKNYLKIADASELEVKACLEVARRYRLDPFKQGQIWFIKRWDRNAVSVNGSKGAYVYTPQTGIYGLLHIAGRDYPDFGSMSEPEYGPMIMHEVEGHKFKAPEWCRVKAFKKGITEPTVATIYFDEFCPALWDNARLFWSRMPRAQIEKCAKARALRTAYPDLGGLYIPEECARMAEDFTPSGRAIIPANGQQPAQQQFDDNAAHGYEPGSDKAKMAENAIARVEAADRELVGAKTANTPTSDQPETRNAAIDAAAPQSQKYLEIDLTNPEDPIVRGDTGEVLPLIEKFITATWRDDWHHVLPKDVQTIHAAGKELGFSVTEILPKQVPPQGKGATQNKAASAAQSSSASTTSRKEQNSKPAAGASKSVPSTSTEPSIIKGTIQHFVEKMTTGSARKPSTPYMSVLLKTESGDRWYSAFDRELFQYISKAKGKTGEFLVTQSGDFWNLIGFKMLAGREFDGKVPVIQKDRAPGREGNLFQS